MEAPEQLANNARFQEAIRAFNEAMAAKPSYLANSDRVLQLQALLTAQNKPVEVTFKSDGNTWVSIQTYRNPEKFETAVIRLYPGDYSVLGRRKGYRDVEMLLQVRNGTTPPTVTVACNVSADRQ
jgi:hypothetical protein